MTASGDVRMNSEGNRLRAERVTWNRATDEVRAEGNVRVVNPGGDVAYADSVVLTDALRDGIVQNMLLVLADGGRLAADKAERKDGYTTLYRAAYSPCAVVNSKGCPKNPTWQINAVKVVHDPVKGRIRYEGASLNLLGARIAALPFLSHPDGSEGGGSGVLVPDIRLSSSNGFELAVPYYLKLAPNRDATITPHVYTEVAPMLEGRYRHLTGSAPSSSAPTSPTARASRSPRRSPPSRTKASAPISRATAASSSARSGASPPRAATSPTAPSFAATTFRATPGCAR